MRVIVVTALSFFAACNPKEPVDIGASCSSPGKDACAVGKLAICSGGKWQETLSCGGPAACQRKNIGHGMSAPICDQGVGRAGNVCSDTMQLACSDDWRTELRCEGGRWKAHKTCAKGCSYPNNQVTCE